MTKGRRRSPFCFDSADDLARVQSPQERIERQYASSVDFQFASAAVDDVGLRRRSALERVQAFFPIAAELAAVLHFDRDDVAAVPPDEIDFAAAWRCPV